MGAAALPSGLRALVIGSGKAGHEANATGVAEALGAPYEMRRVAPRGPFGRLAPYGPLDPRERAKFLREPWPDIAIACGRATVPALRAMKRARGAKIFAVALQDPRAWRGAFDLIWTPEHDRLRGANVITTLTSPHPISPPVLARWRASPDARLAALPAPRAAVVLGGPSGEADYAPTDFERLAQAVARLRSLGFSVMATPSRRTPPAMLAAARAGLGDGPGFVWDGAGDNPYAAMLALADLVLVTGDSANMVGEAAATGAPVYVFSPQLAGGGKIAAMVDALARAGAARRYEGAFEPFRYAPIDSSAAIAAEILRRFALPRQAR